MNDQATRHSASEDSLAEAARTQPAASGPIYFISDLHLSASMPKTAAAFEHFLQHTTRDASAVFILGDLFEYWVGDDMASQPFVQRILTCMRTQTTPQSTTPDPITASQTDYSAPQNQARPSPLALYIMPGNRDFLLGHRFATQAGAHLLTDPYLLEAFGQRIILSHGDALCTADRAYQRFRRLVHHPFIQRLFLAWPLRWRLGLAQWIRRQSDKARYTRTPRIQTTQSSNIDRGDVTLQAVMERFIQTGTQVLIHGHTHRPAHHIHDAYHRWVLSDWDLEDATHRKRGGYIRLDEKGIQAIKVEVQ